VNYFQNGFFSPAGAKTLSVLASVPESSETFSSIRRDAAAFISSAGYREGGGVGNSDFIGENLRQNFLLWFYWNTFRPVDELQNPDDLHRKNWIIIPAKRAHAIVPSGC
jgi:hypothetical protein